MLAIVSKDKNNFYNINPDNIYFKPDKYLKDHRRKTPTNYILNIDDKVNNISIVSEIEMNVKNLHYSKVISAPYWRYHVNIKGFIEIDGNKENIDDIQIMEYLRFS